uniref:Uncharacterized protein n=1 Tax=Tanacetum cinerariifolium TaxID=118510 RepID=A0A6L2K058_TANCI|nr:hypothetical protein [Tanacetum cinerariifolium]
MQMVDDNVGNQVRQNAMQNDGNEIAQEEEAVIQSTKVEFEFMAAADAYEETERVKMSYTSKDTLQQAPTSGTQSDNALVYDSDGSTEALLFSQDLASSSNPSKKIKLTIIPPRKLFVDLTQEDDDTTTPSPITKSSSPSPPNAPSKTPSIKDTSCTFGTTSSSFKSKPHSSSPSSRDTPFPQPTNPFLDDILDAPSRPSNLLPLQSHLSLDITLSLLPITPHDHILDTSSPPPPPQPLSWVIPFISTFLTIIEKIVFIAFTTEISFSLWDEMNFMFAHVEYLFTSDIASPSPSLHLTIKHL